MAYNESIADRLRQALAHLPKVEEKKMFGKLAFMVNGKMCLTAGPDRIMCRIDPKIHDKIVLEQGCLPMIMKGREYKGFVTVNESNLTTKAQFNYWVKLALDYNAKAKASTKKK